jgi:isopenicillin N synthase-like dioxygenase
MYPQHWRFHQRMMMEGSKFADTQTMDKVTKSNDDHWWGNNHPEPSAREGILCERFVCGPPSICSNDAHASRPYHPFYDSDFGRVFYERNVWPSDEDVVTEEDKVQPNRLPLLRTSMESTYAALEPIAAASLQSLAAACNLPHDAFDHLITSNSIIHPDAPLRHHSRLQLNNYPSQIVQLHNRDHGNNNGQMILPIRASRHLDTALLTILCRESNNFDGSAQQQHSNNNISSCRRIPGRSGTLEVQLHDNDDDAAPHSWECVPANNNGELIAFVGSLTPLLTNFVCRPTTHRVSNPPNKYASNSRRMSIGYVLKPDYTAPAMSVKSHVLSNNEKLISSTEEQLSYNNIRMEDQEVPVPIVGLIGRVGWQNHMIQTHNATRQEAVASFKTWKIKALARLKSSV